MCRVGGCGVKKVEDARCRVHWCEGCSVQVVKGAGCLDIDMFK